ncbi:MAG: hypothetical protein KJO77_08930 [Bacteroidia bacterium]|nr:hypothetical protein [Bacteroidia bacterium]NND51548.1 hypothetical protein [Flavobacteriaceae bacterium]
MKDLFKFTVEFFGYVLPGLLVLFCSSLFFVDVSNPADLIKKMGEFDTNIGIAVVITAYIVGLAITPISSFLLFNVGRKIWPGKAENENEDMFISDKYVLVRQFSPTNFEYIEKWNTYSLMTANFSLASLILFIVSLRYIFFKHVDSLIWVTIGIVAIVLFFNFLKESVKFRKWADRDLNATISALKLEGKELP